MKNKIITTLALALILAVYTMAAAAYVDAQEGPPGVTIRHTWCAPCEVWLDEAPDGFSGVRASFEVKQEINPEDTVFTFGGTMPTDLVAVVRDTTETFTRVDLENIITPTLAPVLMFTYEGPPMDVASMDVDDDSGDIVIQFVAPETP